jgi:hypothetical protein
MQSGNFRHV